MILTGYRLIFWLSSLLLALSLAMVAHAQLNENCTVSILNRTAQVRSDGTWIVTNVPANFGQVKARITCVTNGGVLAGESPPFVVPANGSVSLSSIPLGLPNPIPDTISVSALSSTLTSVSVPAQLTVTAKYPDGSTNNVTKGSKGTTYTVSNPKVATISADGLVTAISSGTVIISALNEGALGLIQIRVTLSGGDADGDGIPDDIETANGLNPNDPTDGFADPDGDGLTNKQELVDFGTRIDLADTDGDSIADGEEVKAGADGFITNPLLRDTDGDGVDDNVEIASGSDPTNPNSRPGLASLTVSPSNVTLTVNTILGEASQRLTVTGRRANGDTVDLTADLGTNYTSSDLNICNFGAERGRVFAGGDGSCTITVTNGGQSAQATITVHTFAPTPLGFVDLPGPVTGVDVNGNFAYVTAAEQGLHVVNVTNRSAPALVATSDTPGTAKNVQVVGNLAYVADGTGGVQIIDVSDPSKPALRGNVGSLGDVQDVAVRGRLTILAAGSNGLQIVDSSNPNAPVLIGSASTTEAAVGVDVSLDGRLVAIAEGASGIQIADTTDPTHPVIIGSLPGGNARDVVINGTTVIIADGARSLSTVDISNPRAPFLLASTPPTLGGDSVIDVAVVGRFALTAVSTYFPVIVPIIDVSVPATPQPRTLFNLGQAAGARGIAADNSFVYVLPTTVNRLLIGQYLKIEDAQGLPPTVQITDPVAGTTVIGGDTLQATVAASDDVAVSAVNVLVNGQVVATDTTEPYQLSVPIPLRTNIISLSATAVDFGGNTSASDPVVLQVIPDPGTTAQGRVLDAQGSPIAGGTVFCLAASSLVNSSAQTAADGSFSIPDLPAGRGKIQCRATFTSTNGQTFNGVAAEASPVAGGTTPIGDITVFGATIVWIGPARGDWSEPKNWNTLTIPGPNDRVLVSRNGATFAITLSQGDVTVKSVRIDGDLTLSAGSLTVTEPSTVTGAFTMGDGTSLTVRGTGASFVANGVTKIDNAHLFAVNGGHLRLPGVVSVVVNGGYDVVLHAEGTDSVIELPALQTANVGGDLSFQAVAGGTVWVPGLSSASRAIILVDGAGSVLDVSALTTFGGYASDNLVVRNGGTLVAPRLINLDLAVFHVEPGSLLLPLLQQLQTLTVSRLAVNGVDLTLSGLTNIDNTEFTVTAGGHLRLPGVVSVVVNGGYDVVLHAEGTDSVIELPALQTANVGGSVILQAVNGGQVRVPVLGSLSRTQVLADGAGSVVDLSGLTNFDTTSVTFTEQNGGKIIRPGTTSSSLNIVDRNATGMLAVPDKGAILFEPERRVVSGVGPGAVVVADLNGDGVPDLITANKDSNDIAVLLGKGDGMFQNTHRFAVGNSPVAVIVADLNHDGRVDIVTANAQSNDVSVLFGNGDGTFQLQQRFTVGANPSSVAVADVNRDGIPDLVTANQGDMPVNIGADVSVLLGKGDGTFRAEQRFAAGDRPLSIAIGNLNKDGVLDLVTANGVSGDVSVLLGKGDGTFQARRLIAAGTTPTAVTLADLDQDNALDVIATDISANEVSVLLNEGDGTFQVRRRFAVGSAPAAVVMSDVNRDHILDIITANVGSNDVSILLGTGAATFQSQQRLTVGKGPRSLVVVDLNGDGAVDVVTANSGSGNVSVVLQQ